MGGLSVSILSLFPKCSKARYLLLQKAVRPHCKVGNSSTPVEKPSLLFLLPVLSWGAAISAGLQGKASNCSLSVSVVTELLLLEEHTQVLSRGTDTGVLCATRSEAAWAFHIYFISQVTHFAHTHQPPSLNSYLIFMESTERTEVISKTIHLAFWWSFLSALKVL